MKKHLIVGSTSGIGAALKTALELDGDIVETFSRCSGTDILDNSPVFPPIEGKIQGLVYCPGTITLKPFTSLTLDDFERDLQVNYLGAIKAIKHYFSQLDENSSIVVFSSVAASKGFPFHSSIAGAKSALEGFVKSLAQEIAPKIRINAIAPTLTKTPLAAFLTNDPKKEEASIKRHPMGRLASPEDMAEMAKFLLSEKSGMITGQILGVNGGI